MISLYIREEFGFRHWMAVLTSDEHRDLIRRWETMRGLNCLVPVDLIIPQAIPLDRARLADMTFDAQCHIHECSDSFLDGSSYTIPPSDDGRFWIDGEPYGTQMPGDCPDILISAAVSAAEVESLLAEVIPGGNVAVTTDDQALPMDRSTLATLTRRNDPDWPTQLAFPLLALDCPLGEHPHLRLAEHLSARLAARTLTDGFGLVAEADAEAEADPGYSGSWVVRMEGAWYLADIVETSDGREQVRVGGKLRTDG